MIQQTLPFAIRNPLGRQTYVAASLTYSPAFSLTLTTTGTIEHGGANPKPASQPAGSEPRIPFDVLTGTFWSASDDAPARSSRPSRPVAIKHAAVIGHARARYGLLALSLAATCGLLTLLLLNLLNPDRQNIATGHTPNIAPSLAQSR